MRELILDNSLECVAIQENNLLIVSDSFVHSLWRNPFCEWSFISAIGNSGVVLKGTLFFHSLVLVSGCLSRVGCL